MPPLMDAPIFSWPWRGTQRPWRCLGWLQKESAAWVAEQLSAQHHLAGLGPEDLAAKIRCQWGPIRYHTVANIVRTYDIISQLRFRIQIVLKHWVSAIKYGVISFFSGLCSWTRSRKRPKRSKQNGTPKLQHINTRQRYVDGISGNRGNRNLLTIITGGS